MSNWWLDEPDIGEPYVDFLARVHRARISASFIVTDGAVQEVRPPRWCDLDERGVLKPSMVTW